MMYNSKTLATAMIYAARQTYLLSRYGMSWDQIESNTQAILMGHPVPADGKMAQASPEPSVETQLAETEKRLGERLECIRSLERALDAERASHKTTLHEVDNVTAAYKTTLGEFDKHVTRNVELEERNIGLRQQLDQSRMEGDELNGELNDANNALSRMTEARDKLLAASSAMQTERDDFKQSAARWAQAHDEAIAREMQEITKVGTLRGFLQDVRVRCYGLSIQEDITNILEQTK